MEVLQPKEEPGKEEKSFDKKKVTFIRSLFSHRTPTVFIGYRFLNKSRDRTNRWFQEELGPRELTYICAWERNCIKNAFNEAGFKRKTSGKLQSCAWVKHPPCEIFLRLKSHHKINHFPGSWCLGNFFSSYICPCLSLFKHKSLSP